LNLFLKGNGIDSFFYVNALLISRTE